MKKQTLGRKPAKTGPKPPSGGRVRITINLPVYLLPFVNKSAGRSQSEKVVNVLAAVSALAPMKRK